MQWVLREAVPWCADHRSFPCNPAFLLINRAWTCPPCSVLKCLCEEKGLVGPHCCQGLVVLGFKKKKSNSTGREEYHFQESYRTEIPISCPSLSDHIPLAAFSGRKEPLCHWTAAREAATAEPSAAGGRAGRLWDLAALHPHGEGCS